MVYEVKQGNLSQEGHPRQRGIASQGKPRLGIRPGQQPPRRLQGELCDRGVEQCRGTASRGKQAGQSHSVVITKSTVTLKLERHVDPSLLEGGNQVIKLRQGQGIECLGVVASIIKKAAVGPQGC